jgi:hypothetical protein
MVGHGYVGCSNQCTQEMGEEKDIERTLHECQSALSVCGRVEGSAGEIRM